MKNLLTTILIKTLVLTTLLATTLYTMEVEQTLPIHFSFINESDDTITVSTDLLSGFGTAKSVLKLNPNGSSILSTQLKDWPSSTDYNPTLIINMKGKSLGNKTVIAQQETNKLLVQLAGSEQKIQTFDIDPESTYLFPITINKESRITIGELEPEQTYSTQPYHRQEPSQLQRPSNIIIRGQKFQVPQELIELRAPQLKNLIDQPK